MSTKEHHCNNECSHGATGYEQTIDELKFESKPFKKYFERIGLGFKLGFLNYVCI